MRLIEERTDRNGYVCLNRRDRNGKEIFLHILVAEKALGKPLPKKTIVHHSDLNPSNNHPSNLVICPNQTYHRFIHMRINAKKACGNSNWRRCYICKKYDNPKNLSKRKNKEQYRHRKCIYEYNRKLLEKKV